MVCRGRFVSEREQRRIRAAEIREGKQSDPHVPKREVGDALGPGFGIEEVAAPRSESIGVLIGDIAGPERNELRADRINVPDGDGPVGGLGPGRDPGSAACGSRVGTLQDPVQREEQGVEH